MILAGFESPLEAGFANIATHADLFGFLDLQECGARVPDRKKEFWILIQTGRLVAPIHCLSHP